MIEKKRKTRAKAMLPEIKHLITKSALNSDEGREGLADKLIEDIKKGFPKETPPAWETVVKKISGARNSRSGLDRPWHLGLLRDHPHLSAEAVRHILEVQGVLRGYFENVPMSPEDIDKINLTLRQALWVARLYDVVWKHITTDEFFKNFKNLDPDNPRVLFSVACKYADYDLICDLSKTPCDTSELDAALSHGVQQFYDFVSKQNTQSLRERHFIPDPEGHKLPHKIDWEAGRFVFDPDCPLCKSQADSGSWFKLRMEIERKRAKKKAKRAEKKEEKEA
ncbi:MAG: hypothetical protein Q8O55_00935 [Dehalococcoidales bacterium]|nr:hypothetical protein [Dehalococcoidales bacterium]